MQSLQGGTNRTCCIQRLVILHAQTYHEPWWHATLKAGQSDLLYGSNSPKRPQVGVNKPAERHSHGLLGLNFCHEFVTIQLLAASILNIIQYWYSVIFFCYRFSAQLRLISPAKAYLLRQLTAKWRADAWTSEVICSAIAVYCFQRQRLVWAERKQLSGIIVSEQATIPRARCRWSPTIPDYTTAIRFLTDVVNATPPWIATYDVRRNYSALRAAVALCRNLQVKSRPDLLDRGLCVRGWREDNNTTNTNGKVNQCYQLPGLSLDIKHSKTMSCELIHMIVIASEKV